MNSSFQPQARRFMATRSLLRCCLSNDQVKRLSQAKFSRNNQGQGSWNRGDFVGFLVRRDLR